jgi:hypothetical protein
VRRDQYHASQGVPLRGMRATDVVKNAFCLRGKAQKQQP